MDLDSMTPAPVTPTTTSTVPYLNPLLICMLGMVLTAGIIVAYHLVLVKYCIRIAAQPSAANVTANGVDKKVLEGIPIFTFSSVKRHMRQEEECAMCLGEMEDQDLVRLLPNCKHAFHVTCIDRWLNEHVTCPLCRSRIPEEASPAPSEEGNNREAGFDRESGGEPSEESGEGENLRRSGGLLRHCASLVLPRTVERRPLPSPPLKRSASLDQSVVMIDLQSVGCSSAPTSIPSRDELRRSGSYDARSLSQLDRLPSKWLRTFSCWRVVKGCNGTILPY